MSFLKHSIAIKKNPKTAIATETPNHIIRFDPVTYAKGLHGGVVYPLNFISKFISKNIDNLRCESKKYATSRTHFMFSKNPQTRMNTRKTRNHTGYGFSFSLVELRGVEPLSESALTGLSPGAVRFQHSLPAKTPDRLCGSVES